MLVVAGVAALGVSAGLRGPSSRLVGGNVPVNAGALDPLDVAAHNSPTVATNPIDPSNLVIASRVDSPQFACAVHASFDGGATWGQRPVPAPPTGLVKCFSPDLTFGADGALYLAFTSFDEVAGSGRVPNAIWVSESSNGGRTFSDPRRASGPLGFQVRLRADPRTPGRVYLTWIQASGTSAWGFTETDNPIVVARSDDGGRTWSEARPASAVRRERAVAPSMAIGDRGEVYVAYLDVGDDRLDYHGAHEGRGGDPYGGRWSLVVARSLDDGKTWRESVADHRVVPTQRFLVLFPPTPSVVVDGRSLYVGFHDGRLGDSDVWVWTSDDRGATWRPPRRVNSGQAADGRSQYLPQLAVAPDGRLDVVYYDRRSDPENVANQVSFQSSSNRGRGFSAETSVSESAFDSRIGFGHERDMPELGNRLGLASTDSGALAVWADTRSATGRTIKQDLVRGLVSISMVDPWRRPLRYGGIALVLAGTALALGGVGQNRRTQRLSTTRNARRQTPGQAGGNYGGA